MDMFVLDRATEKSLVCATAPLNDNEASVTTKTIASSEISSR